MSIDYLRKLWPFLNYLFAVCNVRCMLILSDDFAIINE